MSETPRNPFLPPPSAPEVVEALEADAVLGDQVEVRGPSSPVHAPRPDAEAPEAAREPVHAVRPGAVTLVGLHGGAGVTTLVGLIGGGVADGGVGVPAANPYLPRPHVILVARTHAHGLQMAEEITTAWSHHELDGVDVVGLVLVDDAPKLSSQSRQSASRLLRMTPRGWHIPWVEAWRTTTSPSLSGVRLPRTIKSIRRAVGAPDSSKGIPS